MKLSKVFSKKGFKFYFKKLGKLIKAPAVTEKLSQVPYCNPEISGFIKKKKKEEAEEWEIVCSVFAENEMMMRKMLR